MYKIFIRSHLDYCDIIFHVPPLNNCFDYSVTLNTTMEMIEKTQYQAALAITGTWRGTSRNKLYEELGWESLSDRRWYRRLFQFYKICNNMTPTYLLDSVPRQRRLLYGNTSYNIYYEIYCRTTRYMNSFFPDCIKKWIAIGNEIKACSSL